MKFRTTKIDIGDERIRYRNILESDDCTPEGLNSEREKKTLLSSLSSTHTLQLCGGHSFKTLKMVHNGKCWVIELESIVPKKE